MPEARRDQEISDRLAKAFSSKVGGVYTPPFFTASQPNAE